MAVGSFESLNKESVRDIPHAHALVERARSDVLGVGRDGDGGDAVFYGECQYVRSGLDIPQPDGAVAAARSNGPSISGKVQRINVLLMASKGIADSSRLDIPNLCVVVSVRGRSSSRLGGLS